MKKIFLAPVLLSFSATLFAAPTPTDPAQVPATTEAPALPAKGFHGCDSKKLVLSIPTVDSAKAVEICHVNGLTFNLKYGPIGKPVIDINYMGLKSGGFEGLGNGANAFATKGDYLYTVAVGKEISEFTVEYKKGKKYQTVEKARLVNSLNKTEWGYWMKYMENTNYFTNKIEVPY